jgi:histidinol-phosphate aminotransferase
MDDEEEIARRRIANREAMTLLTDTLSEVGLESAGPAVANFVFVDVGDDAAGFNDALLHRGVIVRPMGSFGAPGALRITVGTPDEIAFLRTALDAVVPARK